MATQAATVDQKQHLALRKVAVPYDEEIAAEIVLRIAGGEPLATICNSDPLRYPTPMGFGCWMSAQPALAFAYAQARQQQAEVLAEDTLRIVDAEPERVYTYDEEGRITGSRIDAGSVQWARMRAEQRLKLLAKWYPEKYGEKLLHAGHDGKEIKIDQRLDIRAIADQLRAVTRKPEPPVIEHDDGGDLV